jgi:hypothetical protein
MRNVPMPPAIDMTRMQSADPVEFSVEDAMLNTWVEDSSVYLRLDIGDVNPSEEPQPDQS